MHQSQSQPQHNNIKIVNYINGDREHLPLPDNSVDIVINTWAELNPDEAYQTLRPNGYLIQLGAVPNALCGEFTPLLAPDYPWLPKDRAPLYGPKAKHYFLARKQSTFSWRLQIAVGQVSK